MIQICSSQTAIPDHFSVVSVGMVESVAASTEQVKDGVQPQHMVLMHPNPNLGNGAELECPAHAPNLLLERVNRG